MNSVPWWGFSSVMLTSVEYAFILSIDPTFLTSIDLELGRIISVIILSICHNIYIYSDINYIDTVFSYEYEISLQ